MPDSNEVRRLIAEAMQGDETLLAFLSPDNVNWTLPEGEGTKDRKWSIVPADKFDYSKMQLPVVTLQMGDDLLMGHHLVETVLYVRCYNNSQKTYVDITAALARVVTLLHRKKLALADSQYIEFKWQGTSAELFDQAYGLPFREARFSLQRV